LKKLLILSLLALGYQIASAQLVTESFGTGADAFTMDFVTIGNLGNAADTTGGLIPWREDNLPNMGDGSVAYTYNLGKYEVSRDMITKANTAGSLGITLQNMYSYGGHGGNGVNRPATGISWYEAARYVNWLNTSTGNAAAYKFDGNGTFQLWSSTDAGYNANNMFRNSLAKYVIPSNHEWYKAAYGNLDGTWNNFATGSDNAPTPVASGTAANTSVYGQDVYQGPADITNAGAESPYGTMAQSGNVWEWMETTIDGINKTVGGVRGMRGGSWADDNSVYLDASWGSDYYDPSFDDAFNLGFRVASVPEPPSLSLLALGGMVVALFRRKRG
jgi:formylglycine-generating enzyme